MFNADPQKVSKIEMLAAPLSPQPLLLPKTVHPLDIELLCTAELDAAKEREDRAMSTVNSDPDFFRVLETKSDAALTQPSLVCG